MTNILLQIIICGIAVAAICRTIVYYDGPFQVFPRFRESLLPESSILLRTFDIEDYSELEKKFTTIMMDQQLANSQFEMWKLYHTEHNPKFYLSFKGTLYSVLDCPFCLGPYVSLFMSVVSTVYLILIRGNYQHHDLLNVLLVTFGSYGLHFIISKRWEHSNG